MSALLVLLLLAAPGHALEAELEGSGMAFACWPVYRDPLVPAPTVRNEAGDVDRRMTRIQRAGLLKGVRALRKLELHNAKAACPFYEGGDAIRESYKLLVSSANAALRAGIDRWDAVNGGWSVSWSDVPLSALEKEADEALLKDGPFSAVCSPPAVSEELFVPAPGQGSSEEEKKVLARLAKEAATLRESLRENRADVTELLRALEGRSCEELGRQYHSMSLLQRRAYLEHRDRELGRLYRAKLRWEPLDAAAR